MRLVADIGGTNARVGLCASGAIDQSSVQRFSNADWDNLESVLHAFCSARPDAVIDEMVIAVAGPVYAGRATLTNRNWTIIADDLLQSFSCNRVVLLNDLAALGYALPMLAQDQVSKICGQDIPNNPNGQALVVGIGTGFNISQVITKDQTTVCPPAEAGHVSMPSSIASELGHHVGDPKQFPTVETLFSGRGLTLFCRQFTGLVTITGEAAIEDYARSGMAQATKAIDIYASLLGLLLHEYALSYMPSHGTFLAGSVARAIASCAAEPLILAFQQPSKFRLQDNPSIFITKEDGAALLGCAQV